MIERQPPKTKTLTKLKEKHKDNTRMRKQTPD
jgi:hypothetical protein